MDPASGAAPHELLEAIAENEPAPWDPEAAVEEPLPDPPEPDTLIRRTPDGADVFGAADDDQRMH